MVADSANPRRQPGESKQRGFAELVAKSPAGQKILRRERGRPLATAIAEDQAEGARQRARRVSERLANRRAIAAPSEDELHEFLRPLDVYGEQPVEGGPDVETISDRMTNYADREGLLWRGWDADGVPLDGEPVVLFVGLDEQSADLFTAAHRAEFPGVKVFPACPDLDLSGLSDCFVAAGLNIDDFAPDGEPWELSAGDIELLTPEDAAEDTPELDEQDADDVSTATPEQVDEREEVRTSRPGIVDISALLSQDLPPRVWLENGIIEADCVNKVTAASGSGKTLLLAHMTASWSNGYSALDLEDGKPRKLERPLRVLYVDGELGLRQWHRIFHNLGVLDLPNFYLRTLTDDAPMWPALCTPEGAAEFLEWIESGEEVDVIVLDTLSAFVGGEESSNDTWLEFDRLVTLPLKAAGFTVVYADHTGHEARRARGGSAKKAKLDVEWVLDVPDGRAPNALRMTSDPQTGKMRNGHDGYPMTVHLDRVDGPLGHVRVDTMDAADELRELDTLVDPRRVILIAHMDR
ncbi:MAG: AAA family ATPase, partial [Rhodococcus sp. (in: high G+C Gram-positive bacteria)]|uniref:AAA family ATPase n=1 Tax=Rhodococcus sp. TaxID=1831 RepID=UPI003BB0E72A